MSTIVKSLSLIGVCLIIYFFIGSGQQKPDDDGLMKGITKQHALHFYEVFLNILLNKHNKFAEHAENVYLLNYILRNNVKWRVTESFIFEMFDVTGNAQISQKEYETFSDMIPLHGNRQKINSLRMIIDRNVDTRISRAEWINFCNKTLRPKLLQDLQEWEKNHGPLPNPRNISGQFTALVLEERNHRDLIHGTVDRAMIVLHDAFKQFVDHFENGIPHGTKDEDLFVRRIGYWIIDRFERWDALYVWIYQLLDDNGDGQISHDEVNEQFRMFGVSNSHTHELFDYLDENEDQIITRQEWNDFSETFRRLLVRHFKS